MRQGISMWSIRLAFAMALALVLPVGNGMAQEYPNRPVTIIYSFAPGAGDITVRAIAADLTTMWKQSVVVEIKAGGSGVVGFNALKASRPDGYTFAVFHNGLAVIRRSADPNFTADVYKDYEPVIQLYENYTQFAAHPSAPFKTFQEFVRYAKANPGKANIARGGQGSADNIVEEVLRAQGINFTAVPYNGAGPAMQATLAGQVDGMLSSAQLQAYVAQKRLIALAVFTEKPSKELAGWPGLADVGLSGVHFLQNFQGLYAPAGTPRDVILRVNQDVNKVLAGPTGATKMGGNTPLGGTPEQQGERIRTELERFGPIIKRLDIKFD